MGRPAGQPNKITREMRERAAFWGDKALQKIVTLIDSEDERVALGAATELMNRAYGKPPQTQILTGDDEGGAIRLEEIRRTVVDSGNPNGASVRAVVEASAL